jgi:signal peptidase I
MAGRLFKAGVLLLMVLGGAVFLVVIVLPAAGALKPYRAPAESMIPAISRGDRFFVLQVGYSPKVGDIVVTRAPDGALEGRCGETPPTGKMCSRPSGELSDTRFVKRIVAGPGDQVRMEGGRIFRDGKPETGYDLRPCETSTSCDYPQEITIPAGHWFLLGDNRGASIDSRFWGPVPAEAVEGRKLFTYWSG